MLEYQYVDKKNLNETPYLGQILQKLNFINKNLKEDFKVSYKLDTCFRVALEDYIPSICYGGGDLASLAKDAPCRLEDSYRWCTHSEFHELRERLKGMFNIFPIGGPCGLRIEILPKEKKPLMCLINKIHNCNPYPGRAEFFSEYMCDIYIKPLTPYYSINGPTAQEIKHYKQYEFLTNYLYGIKASHDK